MASSINTAFRLQRCQAARACVHHIDHGSNNQRSLLRRHEIGICQVGKVFTDVPWKATTIRPANRFLLVLQSSKCVGPPSISSGEFGALMLVELWRWLCTVCSSQRAFPGFRKSKELYSFPFCSIAEHMNPALSFAAHEKPAPDKNIFRETYSSHSWPSGQRASNTVSKVTVVLCSETSSSIFGSRWAGFDHRQILELFDHTPPD